jgi:hypothetical protein
LWPIYWIPLLMQRGNSNGLVQNIMQISAMSLQPIGTQNIFITSVKIVTSYLWKPWG